MLRGFLSKNPLRKELSKNRLRKESGTADLERSRYSSRSLPSATTHRSAPVDDRSGAGGEIPRILTICAHLSPSPAVPSTLCRLPLVILQQAAQHAISERWGDNSTLWGSIRGFVEDVFTHISGFQPLLENDSVHEDVSQEPIVRNSVETGLDVAF